MAPETSKIVTALRPTANQVEKDPRAVLTESEEKMYNEVLSHFTKPGYVLPGVEKGEFMDKEKFWLSRECILRFLRATKWKVEDAIKRLEATLKWRREFGIYDLVNADLVEPEAVTGKEIIFGFDITGKPALYMIPSRQNTTEATRQIQYVFWMLERAIDLMEAGVENIALLINFGDRGKNPSISTSLAVLHILQDHYPERLGLALIINVPFLVNAFFKMVMPLVDPVTRAKVKFNPSVFKDGLFEEGQMMKEWWGGEQEFEYQHEKYWGDLVGLCEERSRAWEKNWRTLGARIGESEWAYKTLSSSAEVVGEAEVVMEEKAEKDVKVTVAEVTSGQTTPAIVAEPVEEKKDAGAAPAVASTQAQAAPASNAHGTTAGAVAGTADTGNAADAGAGGDGGAE